MSDPHVSPALKHLRFGVSGAAGLLACMLIMHLLIVGLIHYTDIRTTTLKPTESTSAPVVVVKNGKNLEHSAEAKDGAKPVSVTKAERVPTPPATDEQKADANVVPSTTERQLRAAAAVVQSLGVLSACALAILMFQGVVIAGGSSVPGLEKAVTASSWCLALVFFALPWHDVLPSLAYPGVFQPFDVIAHQSDILRGVAQGRASGAAFFALNVFMPVCMIAGTALVALRFRSGVEAGIIATHASQLEEQIEREIRERKLGELSTPRAVGALNKAMGLGASAVESVPEAPVGRVAEPPAAAPMSARVGRDAPRRAI